MNVQVVMAYWLVSKSDKTLMKNFSYMHATQFPDKV